MLGDDKRRETVMVALCAALGIVAILLLAIGIDTQADAIGNFFAGSSQWVERPQPTPTPKMPQTVLPTAEPEVEPPAPHGPVGKDVGYWITSDDYPAEALQNGQQGRVAMELQIDATGRVTGCTIVHSSGFSILDEATCRLGMTRAKFYPARDSGGQALSSVWRRNIVWRLPGDAEGAGCAHNPAETCDRSQRSIGR